MEKRCIQAGIAAVVIAVFLRLVSMGVADKLFRQPAVLSTLFFMETGRWIPLKGAPQKTLLYPGTESAPPDGKQGQSETVSFQPADGSLVEVYNACGYEADVEAMLQKPLVWDLRGEGPTVLILHSHGSESYTKTENYQESSDYRTLDTDYNVVSIGTHLKELLEEGGIGVIHDTTLHDYPSYNQSYIEAREAIEGYLEEYPTIQLVLDIHRDAVEDSNGKQMGYTVSVDGKETAQLMMVVGTDAGGRHHPNWDENLALAVKLHAQLEKQNPGICRPISFRAQRFNQDLSGGGMLIEVGAAGNTRQEALLGVEVLAEGIIALASGTDGEVF